MDMATALNQMGVRRDTLSDAERESIDRDGYLRIDQAITPAQAAAMKDRLQELVDLEGEDAGIEVHTEKGTDRLGDLVNKDPMFHICFSQPRVLACAEHMISGDFRLSALNSRDSPAGRRINGAARRLGQSRKARRIRKCDVDLVPGRFHRGEWTHPGSARITPQRKTGQGRAG